MPAVFWRLSYLDMDVSCILEAVLPWYECQLYCRGCPTLIRMPAVLWRLSYLDTDASCIAEAVLPWYGCQLYSEGCPTLIRMPAVFWRLSYLDTDARCILEAFQWIQNPLHKLELSTSFVLLPCNRTQTRYCLEATWYPLCSLWPFTLTGIAQRIHQCLKIFQSRIKFLTFGKYKLFLSIDGNTFSQTDTPTLPGNKFSHV